MGRGRANESVAEFAQRHLGAGVLDTLLAPMVAGIFGARPEGSPLMLPFRCCVSWSSTGHCLLESRPVNVSVETEVKQRQF